jgi:hypothetical protein
VLVYSDLLLLLFTIDNNNNNQKKNRIIILQTVAFECLGDRDNVPELMEFATAGAFPIFIALNIFRVR